MSGTLISFIIFFDLKFIQISNEEIKFSKVCIFWALKSEDSDVPKVMIGLYLICLIILLLFLSSLHIHKKP